MKIGNRLFLRSLAPVLVVLFYSLIFSLAGFAEDKKAIDGKALYESLCSRCHLSIKESIRGHRSAARIKSALKYQAVHDPIPNLTDDQIEAIANALKDVEF